MVQRVNHDLRRRISRIIAQRDDAERDARSAREELALVRDELACCRRELDALRMAVSNERNEKAS